MGLRELAQKLVGQTSSQVSQGGEIPRDTWDKKTLEDQGVNPFVPLSQAIGVGQWDKTRLCDYCGYPHRDAESLNPWDWPPDCPTRTIYLHVRCEGPWFDGGGGQATPDKSRSHSHPVNQRNG